VFYHWADCDTCQDTYYALNVINSNNELIELPNSFESYFIVEAYYIDGHTYIVASDGLYEHVETTHISAR